MKDNHQDINQLGGGEKGSVRTQHVRGRIATICIDRALEQLTPNERRLIDDLMYLERWVAGEVHGYANAIECHQLGKRLAADLEAIEDELLSPMESSRRRAARQSGQRRRKGYARELRRTHNTGLPPRIS